jgi:two-component system, chemotaxis family, CheB/CheR fusion protein
MNRKPLNDEAPKGVESATFDFIPLQDRTQKGPQDGSQDSLQNKPQNDSQNSAKLSQKDLDDFESLLDYLKRDRGSDFTGYKRQSLIRRFLRRMQVVGITTFSEYQDYLEVHPAEFADLFNTILINVTSFFRDKEAWDFLAKEILPKILQAKKGNETIRIWSAGCASGEEAFSIAMLMVEALGVEEFKKRVKIFATDIDEVALNQARMASYTPKNLESVPQALLDKCFQISEGFYILRPELRRSMLLGRHNLVQDASISQLDLLLCRNTLMYFNAETQGKILARFHFGLKDTGYLFLGRAELLLNHSSLFTPVDLKCRIFSKLPKANMRGKLPVPD